VIMKKLLLVLAITLLASTAHAHAVTIPDYFRGDWCGEGGACSDGVMRVSAYGFTGGDAGCVLQRARYKVPKVWLLNFKCTEPGRKDELFEETWSFIDEMLVVYIQMKDRLRTVQYLPRTQ
jgi:hypothetical protein